MNLERRIRDLLSLADVLAERNEELNQVIEEAFQHNKWFTGENISLALKNIHDQFLKKEKLETWISKYETGLVKHPKTVGMVMAGNIPLVGFHDFLCVFLSGHKGLIKLSSKDDVLFPFLLKKLFEIDEELKHSISISEIIKGMDAVIATGSNNSSRYFQYYFGKYPHIIRKNRSSVAVLRGSESEEDLVNLGSDIFSYFGLGCRNVSKLFVPENYSFDFFFESLQPFNYLKEHNKYKNNFDYNYAVLLLNKTPFLNNEFLMMREEQQVSSPVAMLNYEFYRNENDLLQKLGRDASAIQCVAGKEFIPFGKTQSPELWDYADNVDTMKFLTALQ